MPTAEWGFPKALTLNWSISMSIYRKINDPKFCTYLTIYSGSKLPPFYIGSGIVSKIKFGYRGSVKSKMYKETFNKELLLNPDKFKTIIIRKYYSRKMAFYREKLLQIQLNVVKSCMYMNMSIARSFGWEGMNVKGENSPVYGKKFTKTKEQIENSSKSLKIAFNKPGYRENLSKIRQGKLFLPYDKIQEKLKLHIEIKNLYKTKPSIQTEYDYVRRNGKFMTYARAFSIEFANHFNMTSNGLHGIIAGKASISKNYV